MDYARNRINSIAVVQARKLKDNRVCLSFRLSKALFF